MIEFIAFNILFDVLLVVITLAFFKLKKKQISKELGIEKKKLKNSFKKTILLLVILLIVTILLQVVFVFAQVQDLEKVSETLRDLQAIPLFPLFILYLLFVRVSVEEIFFRGLLVERIGVIASSIVFGLAHVLYGSVAEVIGAIALGLVLAWFFKKYKNLYANIFAHMLYNTISIILAYSSLMVLW